MGSSGAAAESVAEDPPTTAVSEDGEPPPEWERRRGGKLVWTVHVTLVDEVRPTEAVFGREQAACTHARAMSKDTGVLAASVVRFAIDELGTRKGVAMFVQGERQMVPYVSDCRSIYAGGRKQ
jgi:hypothetical protein